MCVPGTAETVRASIEAQEPESAAPRMSRRAALAAGIGTLAAAAVPGSAVASHRRGHGKGRGRGAGKLVDLTHTFSDTFPSFPGTPPNSRQTAVTIAKDGFYGQTWDIWEHSCTHVDAPGHFIPGGRFSPELKLDELVAPIVVVDISGRAASEHDTVVTPDDLERFERRYGRIPKRAVVAMHSGWESRAGSVDAYRNGMRFPGFGEDAVKWLLERRRIGGIGVDTLSLDHGSSATFSAHKTLLGADKFGIENLRNLKGIPARGAIVYVAVIPWQDGSGGPARVFASR
jgi:kynurenine formamidase